MGLTGSLPPTGTLVPTIVTGLALFVMEQEM